MFYGDSDEMSQALVRDKYLQVGTVKLVWASFALASQKPETLVRENTGKRCSSEQLYPPSV